jgi:hypothetical protein
MKYQLVAIEQEPANSKLEECEAGAQEKDRKATNEAGRNW